MCLSRRVRMLTRKSHQWGGRGIPDGPERGQSRKAGSRTGRSPDRRDREDSPSLRAVGRALSSCPAFGGDLGYGLRLKAKESWGAVPPRLRRRDRSAVNCTLAGRRDGRFQPLLPSDRPSWSLRAPFGAGGGRPPAPKGRGGTRQGDNSASFRIEWLHLVRHTPATSKKQMPISYKENSHKGGLTMTFSGD